jgi:protein-tyrosine phosphatase/arsenate reductase
MFSQIKSYCDSLTKQFDAIPQQRKELLEKISAYIGQKKSQNKSVNLVYICTHNSRRSHFGQIWAHVSAKYYGITDVNAFSGGTEATAFNINAINAVKRVGFEVKAINIAKNSIYQVIFDEKESPVTCFSKVYNDPGNPGSDFAAIMTCSDAEENCPFIPGVELRIGTTYDDPKAFDNTPMRDAKYDERCKQIALETLYVFSRVK